MDNRIGMAKEFVMEIDESVGDEVGYKGDMEVIVEGFVGYVGRGVHYGSEDFGLECLDAPDVRLLSCSPELYSVSPQRFE